MNEKPNEEAKEKASVAQFTHLDSQGRVRMVDVADKADTLRTAVAHASVRMRPETIRLIEGNAAEKGNVLETARIAGIMAAKKTADLIPMCHPLNISHASVDFSADPDQGLLQIESRVRLMGATGVEMEALTAVAVSALTIYDMCKSYDRSMVIGDIALAHKSGGRSGTFDRPAPRKR